MTQPVLGVWKPIVVDARINRWEGPDDYLRIIPDRFDDEIAYHVRGRLISSVMLIGTTLRTMNQELHDALDAATLTYRIKLKEITGIVIALHDITTEVDAKKHPLASRPYRGG